MRFEPVDEGEYEQALAVARAHYKGIQEERSAIIMTTYAEEVDVNVKSYVELVQNYSNAIEWLGEICHIREEDAGVTEAAQAHTDKHEACEALVNRGCSLNEVVEAYAGLRNAAGEVYRLLADLGEACLMSTMD